MRLVSFLIGGISALVLMGCSPSESIVNTLIKMEDKPNGVICYQSLNTPNLSCVKVK